MVKATNCSTTSCHRLTFWKMYTLFTNEVLIMWLYGSWYLHVVYFDGTRQLIDFVCPTDVNIKW